MALGEKVTSIDVEVSVADPGRSFDRRWMEDGYGDARQANTKKSDEVVAGTTGIGLRKVIPSKSGDVQFENILAAKVLLLSTLQEALLPAPPPPPTRTKKGRGRGEGDHGQERASPSKDNRVD